VPLGLHRWSDPHIGMRAVSLVPSPVLLVLSFAFRTRVVLRVGIGTCATAPPAFADLNAGSAHRKHGEGVSNKLLRQVGS